MLMAQQEVVFVLDNMYLSHLAEADFMEVKTYLDIWLENSWHDYEQSHTKEIEALAGAIIMALLTTLGTTSCMGLR